MDYWAPLYHSEVALFDMPNSNRFDILGAFSSQHGDAKIS